MALRPDDVPQEFFHAAYVDELLQLRRELLVRAGRLPATPPAAPAPAAEPAWSVAPPEPRRRIGRFAVIVLAIGTALVVRAWLRHAA